MNHHGLSVISNGVSVREAASHYPFHQTTLERWIRDGLVSTLQRNPIRLDLTQLHRDIAKIRETKRNGGRNNEELAARRYGLTLDTYRRLKSLDWHPCSACRCMHPRSEFPIDRTRSSGVSGLCRAQKRDRDMRKKGIDPYAWVDKLGDET